ncbi:MAG: hypothetical protein JWM85_2224 [Acidimicrobiaceae bacterium]|nr:hypothetical protein [Acidimicrobiaceae bacterium]
MSDVTSIENLYALVTDMHSALERLPLRSLANVGPIESALHQLEASLGTYRAPGPDEGSITLRQHARRARTVKGL